MAARRLIIVLLVLFGISVIAASIAPDRKGGQLLDSPDSSTTTRTTAPPPPEATGASLTARIRASAEDPETVEGFAGDQLALSVASDRAIQLEIAAFGITETAAEDAPADFDLLLRDPGSYAITDVDTGKVVGRLVVERAKKT